MKRLFTSSLLALVLVLVACEATPGPGNGIGTPDPFADWQNSPRVTATSSRADALLAGETVRLNQERLYRIDVPATLDGDLLYFELDTEATAGQIRLEVFFDNPNITDLASDRAAWFTSREILTSSLDALDILDSEELESQEIVSRVACGGPCVITERGAGVVYVRVTGMRSGTFDYDLHVYTTEYQDAGEPGISDCSGIGPAAIIVGPAEELYEGALETFGDRDCFRSDGAVRGVELYTVEGNTGIFIEARIFNANTGQEVLGSPLFVEPGQRADVLLPMNPPAPVEVIVRSRNGTAGPSATSAYTLLFDY